jgi:DNA-binding response OmpR family regulator
MRTLIVEDNGLIAMMLVDELHQAGNDIIGPAESSQAALDLINQVTPDFALIDLDLSDGPTGGSVARKLYNETDCLIVLATGRFDLAQNLADVAHGCLSKPYDPEDVVKIVDALKNRGNADASWPTALQWF